jgi:hypothetical protein
MAKPVGNWDESDVLTLPAGENDTFERKGSKLLDLTIPGVDSNEVYKELAKQLSAFSNSGGGQIVYGVADDGTIDNGGVSLTVKGRQPTKDWLEDIIPKLTEFEILGFNVYEIKATSTTSGIASGKALFIVDVPDSERAPHQSTKDWRYYVRLGGKSQPAPHRMIEDIRNRQKHPSAEAEIRPEVTSLPDFKTDIRASFFQGEFRITFFITIKNDGRLMAQSTCLRFQNPGSFSYIGHDTQTLRLRGAHGLAAWFFELNDPIYPGMEIVSWLQFAVPGELWPSSGGSSGGANWVLGGTTLLM